MIYIRMSLHRVEASRAAAAMAVEAAADWHSQLFTTKETTICSSYLNEYDLTPMSYPFMTKYFPFFPILSIFSDYPKP